MTIQSKCHQKIRKQFKEIKEQNLLIMDAIKFLASNADYILPHKIKISQTLNQISSKAHTTLNKPPIIR